MREVTLLRRRLAALRKSVALAGVLILWLPVGAPCHACYSGLMLIPTAEVIEPGGYGVEIQFDGTFAGGGTDTRILNTEFGLARRLEAGVDFDFSEDSESRSLLNAKYLVLADAENFPVVAIGICSVGSHSKSSPYAVATYDFGIVRGHLGSIRTDGNNRWFVGVDRAVTDKLTLMADYTAGDENFSSVGLGYQFNDLLGVMAGAQFPNASDGDSGFTVHLVFN